MDKFDEIFMKAKTIIARNQKGYKVYSDAVNFKHVEADTVAEAIEKSGISSPYKIEMAGLATKNTYTETELAEKNGNPSGANPSA